MAEIQRTSTMQYALDTGLTHIFKVCISCWLCGNINQSYTIEVQVLENKLKTSINTFEMSILYDPAVLFIRISSGDKLIQVKKGNTYNIHCNIVIAEIKKKKEKRNNPNVHQEKNG